MSKRPPALLTCCARKNPTCRYAATRFAAIMTGSTCRKKSPPRWANTSCRAPALPLPICSNWDIWRARARSTKPKMPRAPRYSLMCRKLLSPRRPDPRAASPHCWSAINYCAARRLPCRKCRMAWAIFFPRSIWVCICAKTKWPWALPPQPWQNSRPKVPIKTHCPAGR